MLIITDEELDALNGLRSFLQCLYILAIRRFMDSKSRIVGIKRKISFQCLAEFLYVEPGRGLPCSETGTPNKSKIRRGIEELVKYGLIQDKSDGECLIFELPLAPQGYCVQNKPDTNPTRYPDTNFSEKKVVKLDTYKNKNKKPDTPKMAYPDTPLMSNINKKTNTNVLSKKESPPKRRCRLPEDFDVTESHVQFAFSNGFPSPYEEIDGFKDYHAARGTLFLDWDRAFQNWLRNAEKFKGSAYGNQAGRGYKLSPGDIAAQVIATCFE